MPIDSVLVDRIRFAVPEGMRAHKAWLLWRDDGGAKVPYRASGQRRSGRHNTPEDVAALVTFEEAATAARSLAAMNLSGFGYAPRPELGVTGFDFDNKAENKQVRAFHRELLAAVPGAYVEKSPSKKGGHAYLRGNGLGHRKHHVAGVEIFEEGFLTVTGDTLAPGAGLAEITPQLRALLAERHIGLVEGAIILAPHWVQPRRHALALPLVGAMLGAGWTVEEVSFLLRSVCEAAPEPDLELADRLAVVRTTAARLHAGQTVAGLPTLAEVVGEELAAALKKPLNLGAFTPPPAIAATSTGAPEDDEDEIDVASPEPMRAEAFYGLAGRFVELIGPRTEACREALLTQFLVAAGCAAGREPHLMVGADRHGLNEFLVLAGATSKARKGMSWSFVERAIRDAEPLFEPRISASLTTGEGLIHLIRDPRMKVQEDKDGYTQEKLVDAGIADKRLLGMLQEFSLVLVQSAREGNTLSPTLRVAWDGKRLSNALRDGGKGAEECREPHVAVVAHVTNQELRSTLTSLAQANGFANRFLFAHVRRVRLLPDGGGFPPDGEWGEFVESLRAALAPREPKRLVLTNAGRDLWSAMYRELAEERPGILGALLARAEAHALRLAAIYAVLDGRREIEPAHLRAALAVVDYAAESAAYVFKVGTGNRDADRVLDALRVRPQGMTRKEISVGVFQRHRTADEISEALDFLLALGKIRTDRDPPGRGRPAIRYFLAGTKELSEQSER